MIDVIDVVTHTARSRRRYAHRLADRMSHACKRATETMKTTELTYAHWTFRTSSF